MHKIQLTLSWTLIIVTTTAIFSAISVFLMWLLFEVLASIL